MVIDESTWTGKREGWDPANVWILRSFLENQAKWDTPQSNPRRNAWFKYWSPRFYVVAGNELVMTDAGTDGWLGTVVPKLNQLVGT